MDFILEERVEKARDLRAEFERAAARYPYSGELAGERNLMNRADQAFRASSTQSGRAEPPAQKVEKFKVVLDYLQKIHSFSGEKS